MMGSQEVRPHERQWLFLLRQDMFNFQRGVAGFSGCQGGRVLAGITADAAQDAQEAIERTASDDATESSSSSVNWARGLTAIGVDRPRPQPALRSANISAVTSLVDRLNVDRANQADQNPANTDCQAFSEGERRVADGSTSNQWNYEIWRDVNYQFQVRYWRQNETCGQARVTWRYPTQNQAWQVFRCAIGLETRLDDGSTCPALPI
jgi:hypothetical protein